VRVSELSTLALEHQQAVIRQAAIEACASQSKRIRQAGMEDLTPEVVATFGEVFYLPTYHAGARQAGLINLARKLKELVKFLVGKGKALWGKLKELLGVEKITQLRPAHIKELAKKGYNALKRAVAKAFDTWPLKIYTLEKGKLMGVSDLINKLTDKFPKLKGWMDKARPKVDQLDKWLRKYLPGISQIAMVAIFFWIWLNVVEFEWDLNALGQVLMGQITLGDLLSSLPGSAIGALMNGLGLGTFTLLPIVFVVRLLYLMAHRYITFSGGSFHLNMDAIQKDFA
jgi:hypothetical protein